MANHVRVLVVQGENLPDELANLLRSIQSLHSWQIVLPTCALLMTSQNSQEIAKTIRERMPGLRFLISGLESKETDGYLPAATWDFVNYPEVLELSSNVTRIVADRFEEAIIEAELASGPVYALAAMPTVPVGVPTLFSSLQSDLVKLMGSPPIIRENGFDLRTGRSPENVRGQLRRATIPGRKTLEFWRDGLAIFAADGGDNFLCWASRERDRSRPLSINQLVLMESSLVFASLVGELLDYMSPRPAKILFALDLKKLHSQDLRVGLAPGPLEAYDWLGDETADAPEDTLTVRVEWSVDSYDPGQVAFSLVSRIYEWFGFDHDRMPYCQTHDDGKGRVLKQAILDAIQARRR